MTSETDVFSVAGGMWTTTQQTSHYLNYFRLFYNFLSLCHVSHCSQSRNVRSFNNTATATTAINQSINHSRLA